MDANKTIVMGDNAYGSTKWKRFTRDESLEGIQTECWAVKYMPSWAKKYPMWLNRILFFLLNNIPFLRRYEKYLY